MATIKNIVAVTGSYKNKQGETKKQYTTIGKLIEKDDFTQSIKIDTIPVNRDGRANIYEKKSKEDVARDNVENDLPF